MSRTTPTWMPPGATAAPATAGRAPPSSKPSKKQRQLASTDCGSARQRWYRSSRASTLAIVATEEVMIDSVVNKGGTVAPGVDTIQGSGVKGQGSGPGRQGKMVTGRPFPLPAA